MAPRAQGPQRGFGPPPGGLSWDPALLARPFNGGGVLLQELDFVGLRRPSLQQTRGRGERIDKPGGLHKSRNKG